MSARRRNDRNPKPSYSAIRMTASFRASGWAMATLSKLSPSRTWGTSHRSREQRIAAGSTYARGKQVAQKDGEARLQDDEKTCMQGNDE
ncbi:hypothetical protein [Chelatococcus asaccharovorans]|uniref:hypothetical protein n=2 Tax=Chelatococcus asaccharovorans TaxID=28210 RepID=UPI0022644542|nr:hypothetical protein [Chelatococcus asaccharovorans]